MMKMKNHFLKYILILLVFGCSILNIPSALASSKGEPIIQVLEQLSEKYQVFFTYDLELLKDVLVENENHEGEDLEDVINHLLAKTHLIYEQLGEKYYVIFANNRSGKKTMRKMKRKIKQIQKLEKKGNIDLQPNSKKPKKRLSKVLSSALKLKKATLQKEIIGKIMDESKVPLIGVNITLEGTGTGTITDLDGNFSLKVPPGKTVLVVSYIGYKDQIIDLGKIDNITITMKEGIELGEIQVVGSRSYNRSATDSPVAVDVIDVSGFAELSGKAELNQILQYAAPSFNATKQSGSDGSDHVDPASLRGLGPDQTLVLINGKRRHQSSLVNIFGTRGRGNTGTDLNAIPTAAIKRIEVLRDGASAQYGSDAIAGVINIVLKDQADGVTGGVSYGAHSTAVGENYEANYEEALFNLNGKNRVLDPDGDKLFDGNTLKVDLNYGLSLGDKGGFANITTEYLSKKRTLRPSYAWRKGYGSAAIDGFNLMINAAMPLGKQTEVYIFGGRNYRATDAFAFSRNSFADGDNRTVPSLYPNGFTPHITSNITDASISSGVKHTMESGWTVDFNNTFGKNNFHYFIEGSNNASLWDASPTDFDAGGHSLSMNTTGVDFSKYMKEIAAGLNIAFGVEHRLENFRIFAGEEASYASYDINGIAITNPTAQVSAVDPNGNLLPGGSQGFPGYSPANEINENRFNLSLYLDSELNLTKNLLISGAVRYEKYSDFGQTINFKLASRYKINDEFSLRGSLSSGFRAPSLAQIHYNLLFNNIVAGQSVRTLLSSNNSPVTKAFGIGSLTEEKAFNGSFGFTFRYNGFTATVDAYSIAVNDRIILTDNFDASMLNVGAESARFFANGVDTRTSGVDVVWSYKQNISNNKNSIAAGIAANFNALKIDNINNGALNEFIFFGPFSRAYLEAAAPSYKVGINLRYDTPKLKFGLNYTLFSEVILQDFRWVANPPVNQVEADALIAVGTDIYESAGTLDLVMNYKLSNNINITIGANNLFNTYPSPQFDGWTDQGGFNDSVQMGSDGAYFFGRVGFKF